MPRSGHAVVHGKSVTCYDWFSCSPFMLRAHVIKMTVPLEVCTKDKQYVVMSVSEGIKGAEIHQQLAAKYELNNLPQRNVYDLL